MTLRKNFSENIVGKVKKKKHFLLFPQCILLFQRQIIHPLHPLALYNTKTIFDAPEEKPFENFMGKGENLKIK